MESVDYVARAKRLLQQQARTAALVIVPLAAAASAKASVVLPISNLSCSTVGESMESCPSGAGAVEQLPDPGNGVEGVKFFTNGPITIFTSGGAILQLATGGSLGGATLPSGLNIPISYDFTSSGSIATGWEVEFGIEAGPSSGPFDVGDFTTSGVGVGTFSGTGVLTLTGPASGSMFIDASVTVTTTGASGDVSINIPQNSLDLNSPASGVPEPGTMGMLGSALAALGLWMRRRRR